MLPWINLYFQLRTIPVKPVTIVLTLLMMFVGGAAEAETVKTTDGRTIILKKDGTYKILKDVPKIEYQSVDINNLKLNADSWVEKKVKVNGYLKVVGTRGDSGSISNTLSRTFSFRADLSSIIGATKQRLQNECKLQCRILLTGKFMKDGVFDYKIVVDEVVFP